MAEISSVASEKRGVIPKAAELVNLRWLITGADLPLGSQKSLFGDVFFWRLVQCGAEQIKQIAG